MKVKYNCSKCNKVHEVEGLDTINLTNNPELFKKCADNSLFSFECEDCKTSNVVTYSTLIEDHNLKFYVKINPDDSKLVLVNTDKYKIRIVKSLNEANEKLRIFYSYLDDRVVEIIKLLIKTDLINNNKDLNITEIHFYRLKDNSLEFLIFNETDYLGIMKYHFVGYYQLIKQYEADFDDEIQVIDENYAKRLVENDKKIHLS